MNDAELKIWMKPYQEQIMKYVIPSEKIAVPEDEIIEVQKIKKTTIPKTKEEEKGKYHPDHLLLANACYMHPEATLTEIYGIANMALSTGNKRKEGAIKDGLLKEFSTVIKAGRGGTAKFLSLTPKAHDVLKLTPRIKARGGNEHNFWLLIIQKYFEKDGYKVAVEKHLKDSNSFVDVLAEKENEKIAIEVCIQKQNIPSIIEKLNSESFTRKILCFETEKGANSQRTVLEKKFPKGVIEGFDFLPLHQFYKH